MSANFGHLFASYLKHFFGVWNQPKRYQQLYNLIAEIRAKKIMEIGTWKGKRARLMIEEAKRHAPVADVSYFGFDLFETMSPAMLGEELSKQPPSLEAVQRELSTTGAAVTLYKGNTKEVLPRVTPLLPVMDFIFIQQECIPRSQKG